MSKLKEKADNYLKAHPGATVHGTSDGFLFIRKQDATAHARTLKDKNVQSFGQESAKEIEVEGAEDISGMQGNPTEKPKAKKAKAKKSEKPAGKKEENEPGGDGTEQSAPQEKEAKA